MNPLAYERVEQTKVLTTINCLCKGRKELGVPIDQCLLNLHERCDVLIIGKLQPVGAIVNDRFLFHTLAVCERILERVRTRHLIWAPFTISRHEQVTVKDLYVRHNYLYVTLFLHLISVVVADDGLLVTNGGLLDGVVVTL